MRHLLAGLILLVALPAAALTAALPGDVAPPGSPDGVLDVADVLVTLSMAVGSSEANLAADVAPSSEFGSRRLVEGDGVVDVADVLLLLRAAVGLESLAGGVDVDAEAGLALLEAARFGFDGFWAVMKDALTLEEVPPLDTPTPSDCPEGGSIVVLLSFSSQSIDALDCDTGEFVINGSASREGSLFDPVFDTDVELVLVHADGTLTMTGEIAKESDVEFEPGRTGAIVTGLLAIESTYPDTTSLSFEIDLIEPGDGDWPIGRIWVTPACGPAIELLFDGSSTAIATAFEPSETRTYSIDLITDAIDEIV